MRDEQFDDEVDIANFDQYHAHAIDQLRNAGTFILAVPDGMIEEDNGGGQMRIAVMGGGDHFDMFRFAVTSGMARSAARDFDWHDDSLTAVDERNRRAYKYMLIATAVNMFFAFLNIALIVAR